jgi:hypothetical protein
MPGRAAHPRNTGAPCHSERVRHPPAHLPRKAKALLGAARRAVTDAGVDVHNAGCARSAVIVRSAGGAFREENRRSVRLAEERDCRRPTRGGQSGCPTVGVFSLHLAAASGQQKSAAHGPSEAAHSRNLCRAPAKRHAAPEWETRVRRGYHSGWLLERVAHRALRQRRGEWQRCRQQFAPRSRRS